jgi:hypothetical protein
MRILRDGRGSYIPFVAVKAKFTLVNDAIDYSSHVLCAYVPGVLEEVQQSRLIK